MPTNSQTGPAGEFYVAAQLSHRGWVASPLLGNTPRTDILALHPATGTSITVQCKAANNGGDFQAGAKAEAPSPPGANEWFIFVGLKRAEERPAFYIAPRNVIAAYVYVMHRAWLLSTRRDGRPHKDNTMRNISPKYIEPYAERWDDLLRSPEEVPYLLPQAFWDWLNDERVKLPLGHPGAPRPSVNV